MYLSAHQLSRADYIAKMYQPCVKCVFSYINTLFLLSFCCLILVFDEKNVVFDEKNVPFLVFAENNGETLPINNTSI